MKKIISSIIVLTLLASTILITPIVASANTVIPNDNNWHQFNVNANGTYTYDIVVPATGRINLNMFFANYGGYNKYKLYTNDYSYYIFSDSKFISNNVPLTPPTYIYDLSRGTYHLVIETQNKSGYIKVKSTYNNYHCNTKNNSSYEKPNVVNNNKIYTGAYTATNNENAWYKFTIPSRRIVKITQWAYLFYLDTSLYKKDDTQNSLLDFNIWDSRYGEINSPDISTKTIVLSKGTYYIRVKQAEYTGKYKIRVTSYTKPKLNCKSATIKRNKTKQLKVSGGLGTIKWSTSNKRIAVVNSKGKVTGKKKGTCYIYARRNGYKMSCKVRVK